MSFIVSYKGQFSPYSLPDIYSSAAKGVDLSERVKKLKDHEDDDFENILAAKKNSTKNANSKKLESYRKNSPQSITPPKVSHARDIMSSPVFFLKDYQTVSEAKKELDNRNFRHFPVLNEQSVLCGIISDRDILKCINTKTSLKEIMGPKVLTALEETRVSDLAKIMLYEKINSLPIINHDKQIVGIVTNTDILNLISQQDNFDIFV